MAEIFVAHSKDLVEGSKVFFQADVGELCLIKANNLFHAFLNICPHQGGPACNGLLIHRVEEIIAEDKTYHGMRFHEKDLHIVCPWHGWEFNVETGRCAGDGKFALRRFPVTEKNGDLYVTVK